MGGGHRAAAPRSPFVIRRDSLWPGSECRGATFGDLETGVAAGFAGSGLLSPNGIPTGSSHCLRPPEVEWWPLFKSLPTKGLKITIRPLRAIRRRLSGSSKLVGSGVRAITLRDYRTVGPAGDLVTAWPSVMLAWLVTFADGPETPLHDRRFGSILPDIRQNTPKTAITDDPDKGTCGERGPDLRHNPRRPLDKAVSRVPQHRPADQRNHVPAG